MEPVKNKKLPIGNEDFQEIRTEGYYYIDKTAMIRDLLQNGGKVSLFTRPRRFGKTLNISMLKAFFETGCRPELFEGLEISKETELCTKYMGMFPVVFISLKGIHADSYTTARKLAIKIINEEARRQKKRLDSEKFTREEKESWEILLSEAMDDADLYSSLRRMTELLEAYYGQKVIVLIDEYDVPLAKSLDYGYYSQMVLLVRNLFEQALKTNTSLEFAALTGCLRIAKESIFTGLNNMSVFSVTDVIFDRYFGFTDAEVRKLLEDYGLLGHYGALKEWYDGYRFGNAGIYCPWDVLCHCRKLGIAPEAAEAEPENYWINTSGNGVIRHFLERSDVGTAKRELERLVAGELVEKRIRQELTYHELYDSMENLWSVLLATGYLTWRGKSEGDVFQLAVPNREIHDIFIIQVMELFQEKAKKDGASLEAFCAAFQNGDAAQAEQRFQRYLKKAISIRDNAVKNNLKENFYQGILLGLLSYKEDWVISSNKESGKGYSDILVEIEEESIGIVIELKYAGSRNLESRCREALGQIEEKRYDEYLREEGMQTILKYGIACDKNQCRVMLMEEPETR